MDYPRTVTLETNTILRGMLRRHKALMAIVFLGLAVPVLTLVYFRQEQAPLYESTAMLMIESSPAARIANPDVQKRDGIVTTMTLLQSRSLSEAVVTALPKESFEELLTHSQYTDYLLALRNRVRRWLGKPVMVLSPQQRAVAELQNARMEFTQNPRAAEVVSIRGLASRPRVAMDLVNTYIQVLLSRTRSVNQDEARKAREFFESQVERVKEGLKQSEDALTRFEQQRGRIRLRDETELDLVRLSQTENALAEAQASREVLAGRIAGLRQALGQGRQRDRTAAETAPRDKAESSTSFPSASDTLERLNTFKVAQDNLARLQTKLTTLRDRYTDAHPLVQTTQDQLIAAQARVAQLARDLPPLGVRDTRSTPTPPQGISEQAEMRQQLIAMETEDGNLQAKIATLRIQVDRMSKNLRGLSRVELQYGNLRRTVEAQRNLLSVLTDKQMGAQIQEQGDSNLIRIMDPASFPIIPTQSKLMKVVLLILVLSGGLAIGAVFGIEYYRQPVETEEDVIRTTGLPVLGAVGVIPALGAGRQHRKGSGISPPLFISGDPAPSRVHFELYRAIRAAVETERLKEPFRSILVTSSSPGEGKSTTALNLAYVFQEFGRRVLLIEGDLRRPVLSRTLEVTNRPGLVDFLHGTATLDQICRRLPFGVTLIPGQAIREDVGSILSPGRVRELLELTQSRFDVVLFDSAPLLAVPDILLLLTAFDRVMLVVKATQTSLRDLRKAQSLLQRADARVLGVVVNQAHHHDVYYYRPHYRRYYSAGEAKEAEAGKRKQVHV